MAEKKRELTRKEKIELEAKENAAKEQEAVTRASESSESYNADAQKKRQEIDRENSSFSMWGTLITFGIVVLIAVLYFVFKDSLSSIQMFEPTEGLSSSSY